jgi:hypothetical protein
MKTIQVENAKTRFFVSKEDYLKFRQAWKDFHNGDKLVWREDVEVYSWELDKRITMKNVKRTALGPEHYMLYNLLRGYDSRRGFSEDSDHGWLAHDTALSTLLRRIKDLQYVNSTHEYSRKRSREGFEALVLPFGDTLSQGVLVALGRAIHVGFPVFQPEEWQDFTKVEKQEKPQSLKERLGKVFAK